MKRPGPDPGGTKLVRVAFKAGRIAHYTNPHHLPLAPGVYVIVAAEKGEDLGKVVHPEAVCPPGRKQTVRPVLRLATQSEVELLRSVRAREESFFKVCQARIRARNLPMKLVDVESQFDGNRVTFYFTAEGRVDFRALVRDLADTFKTRIEMRQIGVRDHAKRTGGYGSCGLPLCCSSFLQEFQPVTLRMARDQSLSFSPAKISGLCGRLKCCLAFEHGVPSTPRLPCAGDSIVREGVQLSVVSVDEEEQRVVVATPDGEECTMSLEEWYEAQGGE